MEKELNIAAILKDKPKGTKLWSPIFGECTFDEISCNDSAIGVNTNKSVPEVFYANGKYDENGECTIFPSKIMDSWEKFAWKKGDVLVSLIGSHCFFYEWLQDDYDKFEGWYPSDHGSTKNYTFRWKKETDEEAIKEYIKEIEGINEATLNLETLEFEEQPKPEFKDGDVVLFYNGNGCYDTIAIIKEQGDEISKVYAFLEIPIMKLYLNIEKFYVYTRMARLATDSEKQQLFSALEKEGKVWNSETKQIEDLPKKCEFEPFQKVMIRSYEENEWRADFFSYYDEKSNLFPYVCVGSIGSVCLPYNDSTKHLLGTTDEWKGGK